MAANGESKRKKSSACYILQSYTSKVVICILWGVDGGKTGKEGFYYINFVKTLPGVESFRTPYCNQ